MRLLIELTIETGQERLAALSEVDPVVQCVVRSAAEARAGKDDEGKANARKGKASPSRNNTHLIGGHFPAAVAHQWRLLVAEEKINGATGQSLLEEAISDLFVKKGKKALKQAAGT